jgi:hypothetical protein
VKVAMRVDWTYPENANVHEMETTRSRFRGSSSPRHRIISLR